MTEGAVGRVPSYAAEGPVSSPLFLCALCFGIAAWLGVNGLWVELPVLVDSLPEQWALPSYYTVMISIGNLLPLSYVAFRRWRRGPQPLVDCRKERVLIGCILVMQLVATLALVFAWRETVGGHSVALLSLLLVVSVADCSSSVFFLPYMAHFPPVYLTAYYAGGSLSGLLPGLIVLAQGANGQPYCADVTDESGRSVRQLVYPSARFGPSVFFVVLSAMTLVSLLAFLALGAFHKQQQQPQRRRSTTPQGGEEEEGAPDEVLVHWSCSGGEVDVDYYRPCPPHEPPPASTASSPSSGAGLDSGVVVGWLLCVIGVINGLANGVLPSVQSYSTLPYGPGAYHLAVSLSAVLNTAASLAVAYLPTTTAYTRWIVPLTVVMVGLGCWIMADAVMSPHPPLEHTKTAGAVLAVLSWVCVNGLFTLIKVFIARLLARAGGHAHLLQLGVVTQVSSMAGSLVMFPLVNVYGLFKATHPASCT